MRVEHEYERQGALQFLAAWDVHRARIFSRCVPKTGIAPFGALVDPVMALEPYRSAKRVFWIVDNGSSHRGLAAVEREQARHPNLRLIHWPIHSSLLNQVEIYFSIVHRKVLTPNDFRDLAEVERRLVDFERRYEQAAKRFEWKFTRQDLAKLLRRLRVRSTAAIERDAPLVQDFRGRDTGRAGADYADVGQARISTGQLTRNRAAHQGAETHR